ncbi:MAG TPA: ferrochelatase [Candidatus Limnocylindrales bacterium]|nr:ferrochelatase [Candidatus Limnocylindrales bacterium]
MSVDRFGVLLMTYGSPASLDDVERYLAAVRGGRAPEPELVTEFRRRYAVIGGSPLIPITIAQAAALEARLGGRSLVRAAMRFSEPSIETALRELVAARVREVVGIVLSPQFSPLLMGGYARAVEAAVEAIGAGAPAVTIRGAWHANRAFVEALASRIREALASTGDAGMPVLLTAHSLPRRVAEQEPDYLAQLEQTARDVAEAAGLSPDRWRFCWQSAGHEPGEWMTPDFADLMPALAADGHRAVLVAPVQFLADHLEILYDVDVGAREQAEAAGLAFHRIASLNTHPGFIDALAEVAAGEMAVAEMAVGQAAGAR